MNGAEMIRNLFLGSFYQQAETLDFYRDYSLASERQAEERNIKIRDSIALFLKQQRDETYDSKKSKSESRTKGGIIGGKIHAEFQVWFAKQRG
jgi:hypothetical protein